MTEEVYTELPEQEPQVPEQQDPPTKAKKLYNSLISDGYTKENIGSEDEFIKALGNRQTAQKIYNNLLSDGYTTDNLGDENEFLTTFSPSKKKVSSAVGGESSPISGSEAPSISQSSGKSGDGFFGYLKETIKKGSEALGGKKKEEKFFGDNGFGVETTAEGKPVPAKMRDKIVDIEYHNQQVKNKDENRGGYLWNKLTKGIGSVFSGNSDVFMDVMTSALPESVVGGSKEQAMKQWREEVTPITREFFKEKLGDKSVTKEQEQKYDNEFVTSALGGLAASVPAMVAPKGARGLSLVLQAQDNALENINNTKEGKDLPESSKSVFALGVGLAQGALEKYGIDKIFGKQSSAISRKIAGKVFKDLLDKSDTPVTRELFEQALDTYTKSAKQQLINATRKLGEAGAIEFVTGSLQEGSTMFAESLLNNVAGKEIFEPESWGSGIGRMIKAGAQEAIGGFVLGGVTVPFSKIDNYISDKVASAQSPQDIEVLKGELEQEMDRLGVFDEESKNEIRGLVEQYQSVNSKIPDTVPDRKFAADKIVEREDLESQIERKLLEKESVDIAFQPEIQTEIDLLQRRIDEINDELTSIPEIGLPTQEEKTSITQIDEGEAVRQVKPFTDKMADIEREFENNGIEMDKVYEPESSESTFESAKEGDVVIHQGKEVVVVSRGKSRGGTDIVTVKRLPRTKDEIKAQALQNVFNRVASEYKNLNPTWKDIEQNHPSEVRKEIEELTKLENSLVSSTYTIGLEQWNSEVKPKTGEGNKSKVPEQQKQIGITEISSEEVKPQIGEVVRTETNQPVSEVAEIPEGQGTKETVSEGSNAVGQGKSEATTTVLSEREVVPTEKSTEGKEVELPVTKSGLTEVEREKLIQEREKKTAIPEKDKETQDILNDISKYNKLPNGRLGKLKPEGLKSLNKIREKVRAFNDKHGTNYSFDDRAGKLYDKNKKGLTGAVKGKNVYDPDSGIDRSGKPLRERDKDVIDAFDQLMEVGALPTGYGTDGRRMSSSQLDATVQDILDGVPSRRANNYLDALEKMVREDDFDFSQPDFQQTNRISLADIVGIEKETATEPMTEEQVDKWLEDESQMTREDERLFDNIENLINEYEIENGFEREVEQPPATTETTVSAETKPNEKSGSTAAESTGTGKESGKVESPESEKPGAGEGAPPNEPPKSEFSFIYEGSEKKRVSGLMRHIQESEKVSEETKRAFKEKGIEYKTADNREARKVASEIIDSVGRDNALALARGNDLHPSVRSAIYAESIDRAYAAEKSAKTKEEADEAAIQWAEISREYDKMLTQGGQFTSYAGHFYKTSPMGFVLKAEADRKQRFEEWYGTKEKDFKEVFDELLKETGGREEFDKRVEEIRKEERKKSRAAKKKKIDDFFDSMKVKDDVVYSSIIPPQLYNGAVEVIKQAVQAGETIANAIAQGVQHISKSVGDKWDKEKFAREWNDRFSMQGFDEGGKSYSQTLKDKIAELERRMKEKDFSAEKAKQKKDMTDEEKQLLDEYAEVKSRYDEARKKSAEWSEKQALKFLDRFKKKVAGLNETQKKEVVRKSIKELSENRVLQYDDFKKIVADALGMKEFTKEKVAEIESLVNDINADATAEDAMVENPTKENYDKFVASREKAIEAQNKLYQITNTGVDLTQTFRSVLTGNLLSVFTLIKNVAQNVVYQSTIRFPKAVMRSIVELGVYGMSKAIPGSKTFSPKSNVLLAQYGYFKGLAEGKRRGVFMFKKGLQERDISSKEAYQSTLSPKRAKEELRMWKAGEIFLTKAEVLDRRIKTMWFSKQADFILRGMGLGDNVQRWGAEFSSALQVAVNEFKIDVTDEGKILSFISAPEKTAYKLFIEQGKSEKEARELAAGVKNQIVREGDRSVLQEENLLSKASSAIDRSLKTVKDESPFSKTAKAVGSVTKTMTFPFVKIPANVFWQMFKIANPEFSLAYSIAQSAAAAKYKKEGDLAKAREYNDKAIDSALTAMYGYGIGIMASSLVANGLVRGSNDEDKSYRETAGEKVFGKQYQLNFGKMIGSKDYWVDLSWFGPFGGVLDVKARMFDDKLDRKQKGEPEELSYINELTDNFSYSLTSSLNSLVFDQAGKTYNAIAGGEKGVKVFTVNTVNNIQNILTGATYSAISKAYLPEQAQLKADNVIEEIENNAKARNGILRWFAGRPPSKISMWGEPIKNDNSAKGIFANIFGFESGSENKFGAIIYDDYLKTGNDKFFPNPVSNTIQVNGKNVKLSTEEHRKLQTYVGQARREFVSAFVYDKSKPYDGKYYSEIKDLKVKAHALEIVYDLGLEAGKEKFYLDFPQYKPKTKFDKTVDEIMEGKQNKMVDKIFGNQFK